MRISDWSSDVCSSDLSHPRGAVQPRSCNISQKVLHGVSPHPHETLLNPIRRGPRRTRSATKAPSVRMRFAFFVVLRVLRGGNPGALHAGAPCNVSRTTFHNVSPHPPTPPLNPINKDPPRTRSTPMATTARMLLAFLFVTPHVLIGNPLPLPPA